MSSPSQTRPLRILGISCSTVNPDDKNVRVPTSERTLLDALAYAKSVHGADSMVIKLRDLTIRHCEANYSIKSENCTWPCWLQQRYPDDGMGQIYDGLTKWCDAVVIATPVRWGSAASLYYQMAQRMNCVENQHALYGEDLIGDKPAGFIIVGGQDNVQHVAGELFSFWSQMGFSFGKRAFVGWTSGGWYNEEMAKTGDRWERDAAEIEGAYKAMIDGLIRAKKGYNLQPKTPGA